MLKISDLSFDKQKSFIPKNNMKCTMDSSFFSLQMPYCLATLLVYVALDFNSVNRYYSYNFVYADSKLDLIQIDLITRPHFRVGLSLFVVHRGALSL